MLSKILNFTKSMLRPLKPVIMFPDYLLSSILGLIFYKFFPRKSFVLILSPMRSGSTLLKALLAEARDVSNLPEVPYFRYNKNKYFFYCKMYTLSTKSIIVLKKPYPGGYPVFSYPDIPDFDFKLIILFRDLNDCMASYVKHSSILEFDAYNDPFDYWCSAYESILSSDKLLKNNTCIVYYDDLTNSPVEVTKQLYSFIGSKRTSGTDTYRKPENFEWKWGTDSGEDKIKALKVMSPVHAPNICNSEGQILKDSPRVLKIMKLLEKYESIAIRPKLASSK